MSGIKRCVFLTRFTQPPCRNWRRFREIAAESNLLKFSAYDLCAFTTTFSSFISDNINASKLQRSNVAGLSDNDGMFGKPVILQ
jgi:hypothetical protein